MLSFVQKAAIFASLSQLPLELPRGTVRSPDQVRVPGQPPLMQHRLPSSIATSLPRSGSMSYQIMRINRTAATHKPGAGKSLFSL